MRSVIGAVAALCVGVAALAGGSPAGAQPVVATAHGLGTSNSGAETVTADFSTGAQFLALSDQVKTAPPGGASDSYKRSMFRHWVRQPDGCTTREVVLIRDAIGGTRAGCQMVGATWVSPYDEVSTTDPSTFDIDHMVPLKEAWVSGAHDWTAERRTAFANDLGYLFSLLAVSASSNRSKGDRGPVAWMPPNVSDTCSYVAEWVAVKWRWNLSMDAAEKREVQAVLEDCGPSAVPLPVKAGPEGSRVSRSALAAAPVPGRFCKLADVGKKVTTKKHGAVTCARDGDRARWKKAR